MGGHVNFLLTTMEREWDTNRRAWEFFWYKAGGS